MLGSFKVVGDVMTWIDAVRADLQQARTQVLIKSLELLGTNRWHEMKPVVEKYKSDVEELLKMDALVDTAKLEPPNENW